MKRDHGLPEEGAASFHATRCTIVMRAAQSQARGGESALAELCRLYWIGGIKTLIHRLRKRYNALLREEVDRTVSDPAEFGEEICDALIATEGRLGP